MSSNSISDDVWELLNNPKAPAEDVLAAMEAADAARRACMAKHVEKKPMEAQCPVCQEDMKKDEDIRWCKAGCGRSIHNTCIDQWWAKCAKNETVVSCSLCRAEWTIECDC